MDRVALRVSLSLAIATVIVLLPNGIWVGHALAIRTFRGNVRKGRRVARVHRRRESDDGGDGSDREHQAPHPHQHSFLA